MIYALPTRARPSLSPGIRITWKGEAWIGGCDGNVLYWPRVRQLTVVLGTALILALLAIVQAQGPFGSLPQVPYGQFLNDIQEGRVEHIEHWRTQLRVAIGDQVYGVHVPSDRDLPADLARARAAGQVGISYETVPDRWIAYRTPVVPLLIASFGSVFVAALLLRNRSSVPRSGTRRARGVVFPTTAHEAARELACVRPSYAPWETKSGEVSVGSPRAVCRATNHQGAAVDGQVLAGITAHKPM